MTHISTMKLNRDMFRFVVLECVTSSTRLVFYKTGGVGVEPQKMIKPP